MEPKLCIPGRLNQDCGHGASIMIVCDGSRTSAGSPRRFDDIAPAHRRTPKCVVGRRSRTGLIDHSNCSASLDRSPGVVSNSGRPSRAAEGPDAVGAGSPLHPPLRAGVALSHPQKAERLGSGGSSGRMPILGHSNFDAAAHERAQVASLKPAPPPGTA